MSQRRDFQLEIITPDGVIYEGRAEHIMIPGAIGYFGVLANHTPLTAVMKAGQLTVNSTGGELHFATSGGFVEVTGERVALLSETAEAAEAIDVPRAEAARDRAQQRLTAAGDDLDVARAQAALRRALNRLKVAH